MIDRYGCDALRFVLATGGASGNDFRLTDDKLEGGRNFANKIWNASRFVITSLEGYGPFDKPQITEDMALEDQWIISLAHIILGGSKSLGEAGKGVDQLLADFQIGEAGQRIHGFFWSNFCDWYIELAKQRLRIGDASPLPVLAYVLDLSLRMLHPFMPFVTEAAWQRLRPHLKWAETDALIVAPWPRPEPLMESHFWRTRDGIDAIREVIRFTREARTIHGLSPNQTLDRVLVAPNRKMLEEHTSDVELLRGKLDAQASKPAGLEVAFTIASDQLRTHETMAAAIRNHQEQICRLARVNAIEFREDLRPLWAEKDKYFFGPLDARVGLYLAFGLPLAGMIDVEGERARLSKQMAKVEEEVGRIETKLGNAAFREKAPAAVVAKEEDKLAAAQARLEGLRQRLAELG
jgi:valyl-tRNA synthetase